MRAIRLALFAALAACGGGEGKKDIDAMIIIPDAPPDASPDAFEPTFDLSCVGNAQPAAAANVTLSGVALEVVIAGMAPDIQPAHAATIDICPASSIACDMNDRLDQQTTPAMGCPATGCTFTSASLATGGSPLDIYAKVSKATNKTTYIYPSAPVVANVMNVPGVMFTPGVLAALQILGISQDPTKGMMLVAVTDCANMPITDTVNLALAIKQNGAAVQGTTVLDASMLDPSLAGTFAIFNVPAGPDVDNPSAVTEVGGTYKTTALRAHNVRVFRDSTTATQLRPGF